MQALTSVDHLRPDKIAIEEWHLRLELAACYRLFDFMGWTELIFNHITVRVPGGSTENPHYLINPFGLHYTEVTAQNLVKIDSQGNTLDDNPYPVNPAGFIIHSAVHAARSDAHCVMHTHTTAGMAVACKADGLRHDNFYSAQLAGMVSYHDFEGVTTNPEECDRLVASLGERTVLILRNHGLLVAGEHIPDAFLRLWTLQRACEVQMAADSAAGANTPIAESVLSNIAQQSKPMHMGGRSGQLVFDGICRRAGIRYSDLV
ncbi:MAG: class II aldolase/adducin family protein [Burkholderiaceae bacterium]